MEQHPNVAERSSDGGRESNGSSGSNREASEEVLKVRRPVMEFPGEDSGDQEDEEAEVELRSSIIDAGLTEIAKKMPIFEPENRVDSSALERPLIINLDLALYRAKMLARNFQYEEAQQVLQKVFFFF